MNSQNKRAKTDAHHKEVAEAIIKMIEGGTAPWQKPWDGNTSAIMLMPFNGASKRRYRGINSLYLYSVAVYKGYKDPRWFTFKQVEELGGKVKRGEKSAKVEYWQFKRTIKEDENGNPLPKEEWLEEDRKVPLIMRSAVFNAEQCEGIPELELPKRNWEPLERAETIIKANGVPIFHDAVDRNYYSHGSDEIHLTPMESFPTREAYYGTALHELGHSTGHENRLNRQFGKTFGDENYAKEELRAEIASFMLCSDLGISRQASDEQHAAYVGSWVKALKSDPNEIFKASADAENICNYLYDREREYMKNLGNEIEPNVPNNSVNYPEIEPSATKVAEQVAGYGVPDLGQMVSEKIAGLEDLASGLVKDEAREIDNFYSTNYVSNADGSLMNTYVIDGKTYLGKSQNVMIEDGVDSAGRSVTHRYYDNSDGSLIHLSDKAKMAAFISERSYGLPQDRMSNIGSYDFDDLLEAQHHETSNLFINYSFKRDRLPDLDDNLININAAAISNFKFGDKQLDAFVKDDAVYVGLRERYSGRGVYDNSDYSLLKVSDNGKMFHLIQGTGYVDSQEAMLAKEFFSERDFIEYAELKDGVLKKFEQVRELTFDGVPFKSPLAENEPVRGAAEMEKGKVDYLHAYYANYAEDGGRKSTFIIDGKAYLGNYDNIKQEPGKDEVGNDVMVRYYDNSDGSLIYLSDKPEMASFIAERSYSIFQDNMADLGKFNLEDAKEAERLEGTILSHLDIWEDLPPLTDDGLIVVEGIKPTPFVRDGKEAIAILKNYEVYLGDASRYNGEGAYDNTDYSLVKVSSNMRMYQIVNGLSEGLTKEELLASGDYSRADLIEYDEMRKRILSQFEEIGGNAHREAVADNVVPEAEPNLAVADEPVREIVDNPYEGMTEVVEFVQTNFEKDGKQICIVNMNGELYLGYDDNCKLNILMGDAPQSNKIISYYDNRDDSLEYLTDRVHMAHFIRGMSYGWNQDQMLMVSGNKDIGVAFSHIDYEEYEYHESRTFKDFGFVQEIEPSLGGSDIKVNYIGRIDLNTADGIQLSMCEKNGTYYIGHYDNFDVDGTYDNSDYSLFRVTNNPMVMELIADDNLDMKELIASGRLAEKDLFEYTVFHERTKDLFTNDMLAIGAVDLRASVMSAKFEDTHVRVNAQPVLANMKDRVMITGKDGTYLGKRQNMLYIYGAQNNYGEKFYDNTDGSLVKLSDNPKMAELISDRAYGYGMKTIMDIHKGEFTIKDFEEYNKIHDEHLSKLEFVSQYDDMGKFDFKEAMKMADEQVNGQVNEEVKEFNPPSDAQLALAESLHCKYKEDVSREELSKIIAKTMDARKKYYEAINQPAKDTQVEVLKEAGVEIKEGLTIGQASKLIAELPASIDQKVFMDRLKIEYAPDVTRGEVEKIIKGKMKELEAREKEPASEKTIEFMKSRGIDVPENVTRGEANKLIYNSAPTAKQMAFITIHKIECDKEKLTYGKASILVDKRLKYIDEQYKLPATEKQIKRLEKEKAEFAPDITRGEASKLINKLTMEKLQVSEKQIKFANDLGLEIPENATKAEVTKMIGEKIKANRIDKIAEFEIPKDRKLTIGEGYMKLAKKSLEKGKPIDDKQIAASLLKDGHRDCDVKQVVFKNSPNCVNDLSKAQSYVNEAKKLPSVKKAMEKENSR